jgi:hypothetical protein
LTPPTLSEKPVLLFCESDRVHRSALYVRLHGNDSDRHPTLNPVTLDESAPMNPLTEGHFRNQYST